MTNNPREASYLLHLQEAEADFRRQLKSGAFGDLMKQEEDDWRPDIDELIAGKENKDA